MKHTRHTAITAAIFAAALSTSSASGTAFAAFSPESQQIAAVLYGPPPVQGDLNHDFSVDARDITLLKQYLMKNDPETGSTRIAQFTSEQDGYRYDADFTGDHRISQSDVRAMLNHTICDTRPTSFHADLCMLAYLSSDTLTESEQKKRVEDAYMLLRSHYRVTVRSDSEEWVAYNNINYLEIGYYLSFRLPQSFENPKAPGESTVRKATILFERIPQGDEDLIIPDAPDSFEIELNYVTSRMNEDGSLSYYDKCLVECDVVEGRSACTDICVVDELFEEPETLDQQFEIYCDMMNNMHHAPGIPED